MTPAARATRILRRGFVYRERGHKHTVASRIRWAFPDSVTWRDPTVHFCARRDAWGRWIPKRRGRILPTDQALLTYCKEGIEVPMTGEYFPWLGSVVCGWMNACGNECVHANCETCGKLFHIPGKAVVGTYAGLAHVDVASWADLS